MDSRVRGNDGVLTRDDHQPLVILGESRGSMGLGAELQPMDSRVRGMTGYWRGMTTPLVILGERQGSMGLGAELQPLDSRVRGNDRVLARE
ncbi:MAG: hypothetical protein WC953_06220 [Pseudomonas sp.]